MEIVIKSDKLNNLLNRRELDFSVKYKGATPSRIDIKQKISALLNVDLKLTIIQKIISKYGQEKADCIAKVYFSQSRMEDLEEIYMIKKNNTEKKSNDGEN